MDAGVEFLCSTRPVGFRASFITDILNRNNGQELVLLAMSGAPLGSRGVILFGIGSRYLSQNRADYYYGVRLSESTLTRPAYSAPATWNL
jgi:outer membrane scaffolding protein for murein synthesis (MipA/OmpV family)